MGVCALGDSYFDGGMTQLLWWRFVGALVTICTLGLCYPLAVCWVYRWETRHTVLCGKRLDFVGTAGGLFLLWLKWLVFSVLTLGIYSFWIPVSIRKWKAKYTLFDE